MRKDNINKDDVLKSYMRATDIEKAPEGFSSKVMTRIYMEAKPARTVNEKSYIMPAAFASLFLILTIAALFLPHSTFSLPDIRLPENIDFSFPQLKSRIQFPGIFTYIVAGLIVIAVFDSGLKALFRKAKN